MRITLGNKPPEPKWIAARIAIIYLILSLMWIVSSDLVVHLFMPGGSSPLNVEVLKGAGFVVITTILLFLNLRIILTNSAEATRKLAENESHLALLTQETSASVWKADSRGMVTEPIPSWEDFTGQQWPDYAGEGWLESIHPEDRNNVITQWRDSIRRGSRFEVLSRIWHNQSQCYRRSLDLAIPIQSHDNETILSWIGASIDLEETCQAHEKLQLAEKRLRILDLAIEQVPVAVVVTDTAGIIEYVNPAFTTITGYTQEQAIGQNPRILRSEAHDDDFYAELWRTIRDGQTWRGIFHNRKSNGEIYTESATIAPVRVDGQIVHYVAIKEDITKQRVVEEQFRQAQKMEAVGQLACGVAHDFNNLLTVIGGFSDLLLASAETDSRSLEYIAHIRDASDKATALTRQLLAFSRKTILDPRPVQLNDIVGGLLKMLNRLVGEHIECEMNLSTSKCVVVVDPGQFEQALINLVVNARDAMPDGGKIILETGEADLDANYCEQHPEVRPGQYAMIAVHDDGTGIEPATLGQIFDPFFTTKELGKGTGLGLSMVHGFVYQSGGHITVESTPGDGTTFRVYLPKHTTPPMAAELTKTNQAEIPTGNETVLVVENVTIVRALAVRILKGCGYHVLEATDGADAIQVFCDYDEHIDLMICDIVMPRLGGVKTAEQIQVLSPETKILFVSGHASEASSTHGLMDTSQAILQKPYNRASLACKVREVLDM